MSAKKMRMSLVACMLVAGAGVAVGQIVDANDPVMSPSAQQTHPAGMQENRSRSSMQDSSATPGETGRLMQDKRFIRRAQQGSMAEVKLGQLALAKSGNADVKKFAQKMVDEHSALIHSMKPLADLLSVNIPRKVGKKDQELFDRLSSLSDADFDKEYITAMVKDHHKDLKEFQEESQLAVDPVLKKAVDDSIPLLQEHTNMADDLAQKNGVTVAMK